MLTFRYAERKDCGLILAFIRALAEYEKIPDQVAATEELLEHWIFDLRKAEVIFPCVDGKEVGYALFSSITFQPCLAGRASIFRICLSCRSTGERAAAGR